ncbi:transposable element Tc1 transposase [Trichonephila clavipes]|nr:transposable element Tc1 transposase [Trichonephila clavipes]
MPAHCRARLQWFLVRSGWNHADWGHIVFSDKFRFQHCPDDNQKRDWRRLGQRAHSSFTIAGHTGSQPGTMKHPGLIFQLDNARPHTAHVAMNCLTACQKFTWPDRSPHLSPIEHV